MTLFDALGESGPPAVPDAKRMSFEGDGYQAQHDQQRLSGQLLRIFEFMADGMWRTLPEIEAATQAPAASISAQLRHLRKPRFGEHTINKRRRRARSGLWEYQLVVRGQFRAPRVP